MNRLVRISLGFFLMYVYMGTLDFLMLFLVIYYRSFYLGVFYLVFGIVIVKFVKIRRLEFVQDFWYNFLYDWFPKIHMEWDSEVKDIMWGEDENQKKKIILCYHPHGVLCYSIWIHGLLHRHLRNFLITFADKSVVSIPITSILSRTMGARSVDRKNFKALMERGEGPFGLVPGGGDEMLFSNPGEHKLFVKNRKGYGYDLVPVFTFGETEFHKCIRLPAKTKRQRYYSKHAFLLLHYFFIRGFAWLFLLPRRIPMYTFMGKMIKIPRIAEPTAEDLDKYHKMYVEELLRVRESGIEKMRANPDFFSNVNFGEVELV